MTTNDLKAFLDLLETEDKSDINFIKEVVGALKVDADKAINNVTKEQISQIDAEYKATIEALVSEREAIKDDLKANKEAVEAQNKEEHDRYISFFSIAKQMAQSIKASGPKQYIDIEWNITKKLDRLEQVGIDLYDDETYALMFKDAEGINIASFADFNRNIEAIKHTNKHIQIDKQYIKAAEAFKQLQVIAQNAEYTDVITAYETFTSIIDKTADNHGMSAKEAYSLFFFNMAEQLETTNLNTLNDLNAYKAELMAQTQATDITALKSTYTDLKRLDYSDDNYVGALQTRTLEIKDMVTTISERYDISHDEVCALAFGDISVSNEAALDAKLLAHSYDINIRDIINNMRSLNTRGVKAVDEDFIAKMDALDLSETRLKVAGVSTETTAKLIDLKTSFIEALSENAPTNEIESDIGTTSVYAQSEMHSKHLKQLCKLTV